MFQDWCRWPDESFEEMDSTLAVQQVIHYVKIILVNLLN